MAPTLLKFEVVSVCLKKMQRHPARRPALAACFGLIDQMRIETVDVDHGDVLKLADRLDLTAYDASYLWFALTLGAPLVTLDRRLAKVDAKLRLRD